jgi:hypothetical protein
MTVTFTLSPAFTETAAGAFNIFAVTNLGATTQIGTDISKPDLITGVTISGIDDNTTGGTITSTGSLSGGFCTNSEDWFVSTPEPTATLEPVTSFEYNITPEGYSTASEACSVFGSILPTVVYAASEFPSGVTQFFTDDQLTIGFAGSGTFHSYKRDVDSSSQIVRAQVSPSGFTSDYGNCPI